MNRSTFVECEELQLKHDITVSKFDSTPQGCTPHSKISLTPCVIISRYLSLNTSPVPC